MKPVQPVSPAAVSSTPAPGELPSLPHHELGALIEGYRRETEVPQAVRQSILMRADGLIKAIRNHDDHIGNVEDFLRSYGLSTKEGLALMVLAEALLRVPDAATADRLIEDKLKAAAGGEHPSSDALLVTASVWALGMTSRLVRPGETPESVLGGIVKRLGMPAVRTATRQAMRILGHQFVLGETIEKALNRALSLQKRGYLYSYDMLGEGARTADDAVRYMEAYTNAIAAIGKSAGNRPLPNRPGISVKLSALYPRYEPLKRQAALAVLVPRLLELARQAKSFDLNLTVDAEEAERLELSLAVFEAVLADDSLKGWDGFGLAVQAYQTRAGEVIDWLRDLVERLDRRIMVRLVKGAYWDTEVKHAQAEGHDDFPVFTRKALTDLSYLACARRLMAARKRIFPQIATHNAVTVAEIMELAGDRPHDEPGFEFQRLHGMGDALYKAVHDKAGYPCRIYAPVGGHRDLLAYLVRRLLENGANSSFVAVAGDDDVPVESLLHRPHDEIPPGAPTRHARIALPNAIYKERPNSGGIDFGDSQEIAGLEARMNATPLPLEQARPLIGGVAAIAGSQGVQRIVSPIDGATEVGSVVQAGPELAAAAVETAARGFRDWAGRLVAERAGALDRLADLLESDRERLMAILAVEAGKTVQDAIAEVREAADFCRYYAVQARKLCGEAQILPGPTGEENRYLWRGRGVFVCISPWNFPMAIYLGQIVAALAVGNTVVAKPAEQTPLVAHELARLILDAGVPGSAFQFVPGDGSVGAALTRHPAVAGVAFTGSTETAWAINRTLADKRGPIVPLIAETGGLNAMVVDATALPEQVTDDVMMSAFRSAGQRCSALRLLFVQEDVADRMLKMICGAAAELAVGDPRSFATDVGPVIDREAKDRIDDHVARHRQAGRVRFEGNLPEGTDPRSAGTYVAPTVIALERAADLTEEIFGPVLHVVRYRASDLDRVLDDIDASGYGLTLGVHSRINATVDKIAARLAVGNVYVNRNQIGAVVGTQPFGGSGLSGTGPKAGGPAYLTRFAREQVVTVNTAAAGGNAALIAMGEE